MKTKLTKVVRKDLGNGFFCFEGVYEDGFTVVIRARATRPYTHAAIHARSVTTKFRGRLEGSGAPDRRQFVTFHSSAKVRTAYACCGDVIEQVIAVDSL